MKKAISLLVGLVLSVCFFMIETEFASIVLAAPPAANTTTIKYGYAMFRDAANDVIVSDSRGQYIDCNIRNAKGEDKVQIGILKDGSLSWVIFYPGRMYVHYPSFPPSTRRINFEFNVAGEVVQGWNDRTHEAVHEILRWYKTENGYADRNNNSGFINDNSLHAPIVVNGKASSEYKPHDFDDLIQFVIEPDVSSPGTDSKAVTLEKVNDFYEGDPALSYWYTVDEPAKYIIYHIVFDNEVSEGFNVTPVKFDRKGKPVTWRITPSGAMKLCVKTPNWQEGEWITLANYDDSLTFEFVVSLEPITTTYPGSSGAPANFNPASTWGNIKER